MRKLWHLLWRVLVVAAVYTLATILIGGLVMQSAPRAITPPLHPFLQLITTFLSGLLIGAALGPATARLCASRPGAAWTGATALFLLMASVVIEGYYFAPGLLPAALVPHLLVLHAFTAILTSIALSLLFASRTRPAGRQETIRRPALAWALRFVAAAACYLVLYYAFGALNYALVTGPYYRSHPGLATPPAATVLRLASIRSLVLVLSITPMIVTLRVSQRCLALTAGTVLYVVGGLVPLLLQVGRLPLWLLAASAVEILFQNFPTGVVAALLLGRYKTPVPPLKTAAAAGRALEP